MSRRSMGWSGRTVVNARRHWAYRIHVAAGRGEPLACYRCGGPVLPADPWDVDHTVPRSQGGKVADRSGQWVSHAACNRAHGAAITNATKAARRAGAQPWGWV